MQPSASASEHTPSTKAALDHLQLLIEHLVRENRHLKLSLQQTRAQLDDVRAHLNRFKLQVAESERNDHLIRKQIRAMATLIQRHRDGSSPPSSPEIHPTPPPSPVSKSSPSPNPRPPTVLPTDVANTSDPAPTPHAPTTRDTPPLPDVNGNCSGIPAAPDSDTVSQTDSPTPCIDNEPRPQPLPNHLLNTRDVILSPPSSPKQSLEEKESSPSTSVSDALQKAFVAMEKDTTNAVHVLHDTRRTVSLETVAGEKCHVEKVPHLSMVKETSRDISSHDANGIQGEYPQHSLNKPTGSARKRSLKTLKRKAAGTSPASDTGVPVSAKQSAPKGVNGRLTRSLTQVQSARSHSRGGNHLAKSVALKKTKKGYKVSLALSKNSSKSGDSSSDSSDDSDSSGPGCTATISRPPGRPPKAQVSLESGFPELIGAAYKLKNSFGRRKKDDEESNEDNENGSGPGATEPEVNSNHARRKMNGANTIESGSFVSSAAIAGHDGTQYASGRFEDAHECFPYATGSPKLKGNMEENRTCLQGATIMGQKFSNNGTTMRNRGQSIPRIYGNASRPENTQYMPSALQTPILESSGRLTSLASDHSVGERTNGIHGSALAASSQVIVSATEASSRDSDEQSLAAGKATANELMENSADAENVTIHEITHVPARPQSFTIDDKRSKATSSSSVKASPGVTAEFVTIRSGSAAMLAWKARPGSKYIDACTGALAVKHSAAVSRDDEKVVMNGKMRVVKPLGASPNNQNHCYVSPVYPDGTFLPYVPVSGVVLHGRPVHWDGAQYADQSVQLSFPKEVFDTLVSHTRRAYRKRHPGAQVNFPGAFLAGHRVRKVVRIEPECSVNMTRLHSVPSKCSVAETLTAVKKDVVGLVLLYLGIESRTEDSLSVEVMFALHSMVAHHLSADRRR